MLGRLFNIFSDTEMQKPSPFPVPDRDPNTFYTDYYEQPLPVGVTEFHEWSDRIIEKAGLPATHESQKFALASLLINLEPTKAKEYDQYFVDCLRKSATNQVAEALRAQFRDAAKKRILEEQNKAAATAPQAANGEVLEKPSISGAQ